MSLNGLLLLEKFATLVLTTAAVDLLRLLPLKGAFGEVLAAVSG